MFLKSTDTRGKQNESRQTSLQCEALENRLMLSTVEIFAAGETGQEAFNLLVDGNVVQTFENVGGDFEARQFQQFDFTTDAQLTADQIEIEFINDDFDPDTGFDNNLFVDGFILDGAEFETEAPTTFSTGFVGDNGEFTGPGFLETEVLNVNGTFSFLAGSASEGLSTGTRIRVDASGQTGEEILQLEIDGELVTEFQFDQAGQEQIFLFTTDQTVDASQLTIRFSNDLFDEATGLDRNVFVSAFQTIDLETGNRDILSTIDQRVFTDASFTEADGILSGFGRGGNLVTDSFLQVRDSATRIRVDALGQTGQELFEVVANGEVIAQFQASTVEQIFLVETPDFVNLADVEIRFINDFSDPATGFDNNLEIVRFQAIDLASGSRVIALPTDGDVFGEGVFQDGVGVGSGLGLGTTLVTNGFFQFQPDDEV